MSSLSARLRSAAAVAEHATVVRQHAELAGPRADPAIIGGLYLVAEALYYAAKTHEAPPPASGRRLSSAMLTTGGWVVSSVAVLLVVPNAAQPWVIAAALGGGAVPGLLLSDVVNAVWDRRSARALVSAEEPGTVQDAIANIRTRISAITAMLEPDRDEAHLAVGQRIEYALVWLDAVELVAAETPG